LGDDFRFKVAEVQSDKGLFFALLLLVKIDPLALIAAVSFYGGVHHKRYKRIAGISS